jgi:hypothetical protein
VPKCSDVLEATYWNAGYAQPFHSLLSPFRTCAKGFVAVIKHDVFDARHFKETLTPCLTRFDSRRDYDGTTATSQLPTVYDSINGLGVDLNSQMLYIATSTWNKSLILFPLSRKVSRT